MLISLIWSSCSAVFAAPAFENVTIDDPGDWIIKRSTPEQNPELGKDQGLVYRIVDYQSRIQANTADYYKHLAKALNTSDAVEDNANFSITFDPTYQTIKIHRIDIIRGGNVINKLDFDAFEFFREEKDRDKLIFNGNYQVSYLIPDVRIGDVLNYSYTLSGKNPAIVPHYQYQIRQEYSSAVGFLGERVLISNDLPVYSNSYNAPEPVNEKSLGRFTEYSWNRQNMENIEFEDDQPSWYYAAKSTVFSSFADWAEVGTYFSDRYRPGSNRSTEIRNIVQDIKSRADIRPAILIQFWIRGLAIAKT